MATPSSLKCCCVLPAAIAAVAFALPALAEPPVEYGPTGSFADVPEDEVLRLAQEPEPGNLEKVEDAKTVRTNGAEYLVALVGPGSGWPTASNGTIFCDLLVFHRKAGRLAVLTRKPKVVNCGGATDGSLDLSIDLDSNTRLIGVRTRYMNHGFGKEQLTLFRLEKAYLQPVFFRTLSMSDPSGVEVRFGITMEKAKFGPNTLWVEEESAPPGREKMAERWVYRNGSYERISGLNLAPLVDQALGQGRFTVTMKGRYTLKVEKDKGVVASLWIEEAGDRKGGPKRGVRWVRRCSTFQRPDSDELPTCLCGYVTDNFSEGGTLFVKLEEDQGFRLWGAVPAKELKDGQRYCLDLERISDEFESKVRGETLHPVYRGQLTEE